MKICRISFWLMLCCLFLPACQSIKELDIWPMVYYEKDEKKNETRLDLAASLYSYQDTPKITSYAFRPWFVGEFSKEEDLTQLMFAWPFIYARLTPDDKKIWLLPMYYSRDIKRPDFGERDYDWFFLPFITLGGTDTKEGSYLYMTLWGNIKGLLMYDEITMTPFPFYVKARDGEYVTKGYLWPLFRFGDGGGKRFRFYCMFYSEYEKEGKFRRRSYMWPFVHYNEEDLDKKHPRKEFMFFPLYGQSISDVAVSRSLLWPFFSYAKNEESGYTEYNCPWPFFKTRKDKAVDELRVWPFYWKSETKIAPEGKEDDLVLLWPIYWHTQSEYTTYQKESRYVLPFYWSHWRKGKGKDGQESSSVKIWPLCDYEKKEDGTVRYRAISPFWFEDYLPEGFQKAWAPFFTVFDYSKGPEGKKTFSMLGPLYQYKADEESLYHRFLFFSYKKTKNPEQDFKRFSVLGGLFEYKEEKGESSLRFFYLPSFGF
ncbi:MAG: hypothetical protein HUU50_00475 [Candidatus Brocadiae bacterium]|nr:hypothetical protein [Candidatus Brocadiia bacterium]